MKLNKTTVDHGQSFLDKVIQSSGSVEQAIDMAMLNDIAITDEVQTGMELSVKDMVTQRVTSPATAIDASVVILKEGLEYWDIENYII
jgi:hypothetical protein